MAAGSPDTRLIVLRGNSGSGKSSVAAALRAACGYGLAWVSQDLIRRNILREHDRPGGVNIGLIDLVTRHCLDAGYHVVMDGIFATSCSPARVACEALSSLVASSSVQTAPATLARERADRYEPMLAGLHADHRGQSRFYYFDISLAETLRRHATRPQSAEFGPAEMTGWYRARDLLGSVPEQVIGESATLDQATGLILAQTRLLDAAAVAPLRRATTDPAAPGPAAGAAPAPA